LPKLSLPIAFGGVKRRKGVKITGSDGACFINGKMMGGWVFGIWRHLTMLVCPSNFGCCSKEEYSLVAHLLRDRYFPSENVFEPLHEGLGM